MKKKSNEETIEELTKNEILAVETNDKIAKLEKEKLRNKKVIAEYKEREKATTRALVLYERKIKWLKDTLVNDILNVCKNVNDCKDDYLKLCDSLINHEIRDNFASFSSNILVLNDKLYDICNKLEANAQITKSDRDYISNRKKPEKQKLDSESRFDRLKREFAQKIGDSVNRKPGRPKKQDQSIVSEIGLGHRPEVENNENVEIENKLNNLFYNAPTQKTTISNIPQTSDSVFDFNEALNPNISLKDIMNDLMSDKQDEETTIYNLKKDQDNLKQEETKSRIEMLESGFIKSPKIMKKLTENKTIDQQKIKPTFEKRFLSIQDIVKKSTD